MIPPTNIATFTVNITLRGKVLWGGFWDFFVHCLCKSVEWVHWLLRSSDCDSVWSFWVEANLCRFFILSLYLYCWFNYQRGRVGIPLTIFFTQPHFCACPKPWPRFPMPYIMVFFCFSCRRLLVLLIYAALSTIGVKLPCS